MKRQRRGGFLIAQIHRSAGRIFARMLRARGLEISPEQGRILFVLWEEGPMPIHDLARRVSLGKSTLTSALDRLEAGGQVIRVRSLEDRRRIVIQLAPGNRALHALYEEVSREMAEVFYRGFAAREIDGFESTLERILENLKHAESGRPAR